MPSLLKGIEKQIRQMWNRYLVRRAYGTLRPERARLYGCENWIHIDPEDACAWKKVVAEPLRHKVSPNLVFWRDHIQHLSPDCVLDIGVNYGECLAGARYTNTTRAIGFEANPNLLPFLHKTIADHPNADRVSLEHFAVTETSTESVAFHIMKGWSGGSSAREMSGPMIETVSVPGISIDDYAQAHELIGKCLLYKIDVEGFEASVMKGADDTFRNRFDGSIGFVEFDTEYLRATGINVVDYWNWLNDRYTVMYARPGCSRRLETARELEALPYQKSTRKHHVDLVLIHGDPRTLVSPQWKIASQRRVADCRTA